jgi:hypothetical protein
MGNLNTPLYRRDYKGEAITYVQDDKMKSVFATPRSLPYDMSVKSAVVLGNGVSRLESDIQLILSQNNVRLAEGYKFTYACNAAYRDTTADYYVIKDNVFFSEISLDQYNKMFTPNDIWVAYKDTNLLPHCYHVDAGSAAAYLAAFDGANNVFLFGFDGSDNVTSENVYTGTVGYEHPKLIENFDKFNIFLYSVIKTYNSTMFYRVRNHLTNDFNPILKTLPNYREITVRDAVILGDF